MKDQQTKRLLQAASEEIKFLRKDNERMNLRLSGFEDALLLLRTPPHYPPQGMAEDIAHLIDKQLKEMEADELAPKAKNAFPE